MSLSCASASQGLSTSKYCKAHVSPPPDQCVISSTNNFEYSTPRRSANYQSCIWSDDYMKSLTIHYKEQNYRGQSEKLKEAVRKIIQQVENPLDQLELIDALQRLGLAYHFEIEIKNLLEKINAGNNKNWKTATLYATALQFRLLRQHGYHVSQEVFDSFRDKTGSFKEEVREDIKGMLGLYEAAFHSFEGESIMEEALDLTTKHLKAFDLKSVDPITAMEVKDALELPLQWRMPRLEARRFIYVYERSRQDMNPLILELAKLDFNIVQGIYQQELKDVSSWWNKIGLGENMSFARDRLVEAFSWSVGITFEPQFGNCRKIITMAIAFITVIDDVYDVYGTMDELELFDTAIHSWDIQAMKNLPDYMRLCFLVLYNFVNEAAYEILKEQNADTVSNLRKAWEEQLRSYLVEAKWYHGGYRPTLEEYMNNAWISIATPLVLLMAYLFVTNPIIQTELEFLESHPDILRWASIINRFQDDLGTSSDELKRGDVPKSIQCYMQESGASEEKGREHIRKLMLETWKKVNQYHACASIDHDDPIISRKFMQVILDFIRTSHSFYNNGDGHGVPDLNSVDRTVSLLFQPIPL